MDYRSDFLVIGSGIAGLSAALRLSRLGRVHIVTKKETLESNTNYAQGGIAAVMAESDSIENHVQDTLKAGAGLCREEIVRLVVADGPARVRELMELGVRFTAKERKLDLGLEGGHSHRRILHAGDLTGHEIERALAAACLENPSIRVFENHVSIDLILAKPPAQLEGKTNRAWGVYALEQKTGRVHSFSARATILASGGAGKVYLYTSNPDIATGDGMAMAYRAGARLANLEFVQFHPTCLYLPGASGGDRRFLLSEALRGEGGVLLRKDQTRLMEGMHPQKDLAPRDVVARAIDAEMKKSGAECVFLDMTKLPADFLRERFPTIYAHCLKLGLDMTKTPLPVVPAAHFFCGGIETDSDGATDIPGLFAIGEVAHTGLHGANRLASNSLLEGCVFAHRAAQAIERQWQKLCRQNVPAPHPWSTGKAVPPNEAVVIQQDWNELRRVMWNYVGIARSDRRLKRALERIRIINEEVFEYYWDFLLTRDLIELRNIALLAELIALCALRRRESRGLHCSIDHPKTLESSRHDTLISRYLRGKAEAPMRAKAKGLAISP